MGKDANYFMKRAIKLAVKGKGRTSPNPLVGAIIVKEGKIIGKGYHTGYGLAHAEVEAIRDAGKKVKDAILYVTLEPCSTFGKTPACTDLIIEKKIKKVVIATEDPNPVNKNKGIKVLKKAGIDVELGIMEEEAKNINKVFEKFSSEKRPFITAKVAQSLDGKIATASGESRWITSPESRKHVHMLRSQVDGILVGINTILKDDPLLTNRLYRSFMRQPVKIVLDSKLRIPYTSKIFSKKSPKDVILATTKYAPNQRKKFFESKGIKVVVVKSKNKRIYLKDLMRRLAKLNISHILVEGGGEVLGALVKENLIDRILFFISPKIIGGTNAPTSIMGEGIEKLRLARRLKNVKIRRFKEDLLIEGDIK